MKRNTARQTHRDLVSPLVSFMDSGRDRAGALWPAVSLFSGAGISDYGYEAAGFKFAVQAEIDWKRARVAAENFPHAASVVGDLRKNWKAVVEQYKSKRSDPPALLCATPPCQGMSSSNPGRGKISDPDAGGRDQRNLLLLAVVPVVRALQPRVVVIENVPQLLLRVVHVPRLGQPQNIVKAFCDELEEYVPFAGTVQMADYGVPQLRRRSIIVLIHASLGTADELAVRQLSPWPRPTHANSSSNGCLPWVTLERWFEARQYKSLDAKTEESARDPNDPLHFVTAYDEVRYRWVADIPPRSAKNAYENSRCHQCRADDVPLGLAHCPQCTAPMLNRPHVRVSDSEVRLIRGFKSSYRRMPHDRPAPTVTTASSHLGSDYKIHPWEHRVLSVRECAELQTVPRQFDWTWALNNGYRYLIRQVVGEAIPPLFTYLHGRVLVQLLQGRIVEDQLAQAKGAKSGSEP